MSLYTEWKEARREITREQYRRRRALRSEDEWGRLFNARRKRDPRYAHLLLRIAQSERRNAEWTLRQVRRCRVRARKLEGDLRMLMGDAWVDRVLADERERRERRVAHRRAIHSVR